MFGHWLLGYLLSINKKKCCLSFFSRCSLLLAKMFKWNSYALISLISSTYKSNTISHLVRDRTYYSKLGWELFYCGYVFRVVASMNHQCYSIWHELLWTEVSWRYYCDEFCLSIDSKFLLLTLFLTPRNSWFTLHTVRRTLNLCYVIMYAYLKTYIMCYKTSRLTYQFVLRV